MGRSIDTAAIENLRTRVRREIDSGLLPSAQIALALEGEVILDETIGDAAPESRYCVFSATKPFVAGTIWTLMQEGALDVSQRVADLIPEFGTNGKEVVTVEQVMLHLSGFPSAPLGPPAWSTKAGRLEAFGKWRLQWEPGTKYEYHPTSAHWVLAELIDRVTGADYRDVIAERITTPIGLPRVLGITEPVPVRVPHSVGGFPTPDELEEVFGVRELGVTEVTSDAMTYLAHPDAIAVGLPGGGGIMRAADLVVFYQELLHNTHGIWDPAVLDDAKTNVRNMLPDALTGVPASRTLGLVTAGADGRGSFRSFGKTNSAGAFGHSGAFGQVAWADPETGLSFAYLTDGLDEHVIRQAKRGIALSSLANLCVQ